ncbi:MAG: zinc ribbon domain-containing protein [Ruminococcaceae bacterium]|nr:zinc ribbon domain-containing protein [Oscillospiraceae bacterium]
MYCQNCGTLLNGGATVCPVCGTQQANAQAQYQQPQYQQPMYQNPVGSVEAEMNNIHTLGLVALIVGIFVPLVGYICGAIGLSKIGKIKSFATPAQQPGLKKDKTLCILGIVIPAALRVLGIVLYIVVFSSMYYTMYS